MTSKALQALYNGKLFDQLVCDLSRYVLDSFGTFEGAITHEYIAIATTSKT